MGVSLMLCGNSDIGKEYDDNVTHCAMILSRNYFAMISSDYLFEEYSFVRELERHLNLNLDILINYTTTDYLGDKESLGSKYWIPKDELTCLCEKIILKINDNFPHDKVKFYYKKNINQGNTFKNYLRYQLASELREIISCIECYSLQGATHVGFGVSG